MFRLKITSLKKLTRQEKGCSGLEWISLALIVISAIIDIILDEIVQDKCLLTDEEYAMGPEMWNETMEELDTSKLPDMACEGRGKRWRWGSPD